MLTALGGPSFVAGDLIDVISVAGDTLTAGGGRIEIGLSYVLDPLAFDDRSRNNFPPNPDDVLIFLFFITEQDDQGQDIYDAVGTFTPETILESATLGPSEFGGGLAIGDLVSNAILGNRFSIIERTRITAIGGHLNTFDGVNLFNRGSIWGVIIPMSGVLPAFDASEIEANALVNAIFEDDNPSSGDLREPVSLVLNPGDYALLFGGGGLFGTTGQAIMPTNGQVRLPGFSNFFWDGRPGNTQSQCSCR